MDTTWYVIIGMIALASAYMFISKKPRKVAKEIGRFINIRPSMIETMYSFMGAERGRDFVDRISEGGEERLKEGIYTFVVYRVMLDDSPYNLSWWRGRLKESGLDPNISEAHAAFGFYFLETSGARIDQIPNFLKVFNSAPIGSESQPAINLNPTP